jgi:bacillithiol biosynthesis cysteine-adding enzyme BshC
MMERSMECHWIPSAELPRTALLYSTFLNDFPRVSEFYGHPPNLDGILRAAAEIRLEVSQRRSVVEVLRAQNQAFGGDQVTQRNLDRLEAGAVAVVTGQQVGLFGGPAYTVYKALTAVRVAEELTARGTDAVPVFWLATEDHDLAEVDHCFFGVRGGVERLVLDASDGQGRRVGEIRLGEAIVGVSARAREIVNGAPENRVTRWIAESYLPEETLGSAFAKLMTRLLAGTGMIFLDPVSPELHRLSMVTMRRALAEHQPLAEELLARSEALEKAGFHAQVKVADRHTLLFRIVDGHRVAIRAKDGAFVSGRMQQSREAALKALEEHPEQFSASALLRPVVQDTLLPTAAYVAGPSEVAYYAQVSVVYRRLLGRAPVVLPRAGFTLVNAQVGNLLKKYNLDIQDVIAGRHRFRAKMEAQVLPKTLMRRFSAGEKTLQRVFGGLREPLAALDQTLVGALDNAAEKVLYQFNSLRGKAGRAEGFRTGVLETHEREISSLLLPNKDLQERSLSLLPFLAGEGELLDHLARNIKIGSGEHGLVYL